MTGFLQQEIAFTITGIGSQAEEEAVLILEKTVLVPEIANDEFDKVPDIVPK